MPAPFRLVAGRDALRGWRSVSQSARSTPAACCGRGLTLQTDPRTGRLPGACLIDAGTAVGGHFLITRAGSRTACHSLVLVGAGTGHGADIIRVQTPVRTHHVPTRRRTLCLLSASHYSPHKQQQSDKEHSPHQFSSCAPCAHWLPHFLEYWMIRSYRGNSVCPTTGVPQNALRVLRCALPIALALLTLILRIRKKALGGSQ